MGYVMLFFSTGAYVLADVGLVQKKHIIRLNGISAWFRIFKIISVKMEDMVVDEPYLWMNLTFMGPCRVCNLCVIINFLTVSNTIVTVQALCGVVTISPGIRIY